MGRTACTEPQCLYKGALYLKHLQVTTAQKNILNTEHDSMREYYYQAGLPLHPSPSRDVQVTVGSVAHQRDGKHKRNQKCSSSEGIKVILRIESRSFVVE
jgi:hypothetical protein